MKTNIRSIAFLMAALLLFGGVFAACARTPADTEDAEGEQTAGQAGQGATEEFFLPLEDGYNQVTFYWSHPDGYENCDMWIWYGDKAGKGHLFTECDYGAKVVVNVPEEVEELGFIVRRDCSEPGGSSWGSATKDYEQDRFAVIEGKETFVYLKTGDASQYKSDDGGKTLYMAKKFQLAGIVDSNRIHYSITPKMTLTDIAQVKLFEGDREIAVTELTSQNRESASGDIVVAETLDLSKSYRMVIEGYGEKAVVPTEIFDSEYFAENFHYDGNDLGAVIEGEHTTFKVWAPTASKVVLNLFADGDGTEAYKQIEMVRGEKGVWAHTEPCGHGTYYTYTVTTSVGMQEAVDPYAKAAGVNGNRGMVVDLSLTDPEGWENDALADPIAAYSEAVIWEIHIRDFSNKMADTEYPGKYLAFTEAGLKNEYGEPIGIDYLKELGITHVHLLPVYDYATVDESDPDAEFNWGYDPKNYNVPEGSYSTDPFRGEVRIREFKQMVQALHEAGIGVIMDMVYNHTYDGNSSFNRIVPYYYYRYTNTGANSSASGCGNDTASERYMFGKFMQESTAYWAEEYHLDGMRFDLMGLHDLKTMQNVESRVHAVNPHAILYGEGWTMGATVDGSPQANQSNISQITATDDAIGSVAVFNDVIRDGLKGSVFDKTARGYISGEAGRTLNDIVFGIRGGQGAGRGWSVKDAMVINYMSAHDNHTLWDKLLLSNPNHSDEDRMKMNKLGAAIVLISKGTPFWQAGEEMLRSKNGDENSYKSSDAVNNLDWSVLKAGSREYEMMRYYRGLIAIRKAFAVFTSPTAEITAVDAQSSGILAVRFADGSGGEALVVINPHNTALPYTLDGEWKLVADGNRAGTEVLATENGSISIEGISVRIYVNAVLLP